MTSRKLKRWQRLARNIAVLFVVGMIFDLVWAVITGHAPSWWVHMLSGIVVVLGWDIYQNIRLRIAFYELVDAIENRPAYGQSVDDFLDGEDQ
jgi:hypothetical protein